MKKNDYTSPAIDCQNWELEGVICGSLSGEDTLDFGDLPDYKPSEGLWY